MQCVDGRHMQSARRRMCPKFHGSGAAHGNEKINPVSGAVRAHALISEQRLWLKSRQRQCNLIVKVVTTFVGQLSAFNDLKYPTTASWQRRDH